MVYNYKSISKKEFFIHFLLYLFYTSIICTVIAVLFVVVGSSDFLDSFIISQSIGLSVCSCVVISLHIIKPEKKVTIVLILIPAILIGVSAGFILGFKFAGLDTSELFGMRFFLRYFIISTIFGVVISYFFFSKEIMEAKEATIQEERIKRLDTEKKAVETNLRLLQAQIEPHFLFNTLSNVLSLLDTDLDKGKSMLEDLIHYLRTTLSKTRDAVTTIGEEMQIVEAYLKIFKVRMGERLEYNISIPDEIKNIEFHPMLIQPLVENAIRHGLEPEIKGGEIWIKGSMDGNILRLEIADTGVGLYENSNPGMGIDNIKERLKSLYGDEGRLILKENHPSGLKAIIEVPYEAH
ncbi:sensor histidine kinase [Thermodesulfobacteriota bacterium]